MRSPTTSVWAVPVSRIDLPWLWPRCDLHSRVKIFGFWQETVVREPDWYSVSRGYSAVFDSVSGAGWIERPLLAYLPSSQIRVSWVSSWELGRYFSSRGAPLHRRQGFKARILGTELLSHWPRGFRPSLDSARVEHVRQGS